MNLIDEEVTHKVFGEGNIVDHDESIITVDFQEDTKKFIFPDALGKFITLNDPDTAKHLEQILLEKEKERQEAEKRRQEEREQRIAEEQRREKLKNLKIHESSQIVFWLDEEEQKNIFSDWQAFTGNVQSGKSKGEPNRASRLRPNSACILTARGPDQSETDRKILGLYMVDDTFFGNHMEDGMVPAHADYRIQLTDEEAEQMLFWNYYVNENHPHRTTWNSGKYRYFKNVWTAQILKDIREMRNDEEAIQNVQGFLEYFCQMNVLDINDIPEANGALKR